MEEKERLSLKEITDGMSKDQIQNFDFDPIIMSESLADADLK